MRKLLLKLKQIIIFYLVLFIILILYFLVSSYFSSEKLEVDFLDIGQGDSSLIKLPEGQLIVIDGGPDNLVLKRLGENLSFYKRHIDYLILSHYHNDHVTGLLEIINRYQVGTLIYSVDSPLSSTLVSLLKLAKRRQLKIEALSAEAKIIYSDACFLNLINPSILNIKFDPNNSILVRLDCAQKTFLFAGDDNAAVEQAVLRSKWKLRADVFKSSHHGSKTANTKLFLQAIKPQLMSISVGKNNKFGHPSPEVVDRAVKLGIKVLRTDQVGTIKVFSQ